MIDLNSECSSYKCLTMDADGINEGNGSSDHHVRKRKARHLSIQNWALDSVLTATVCKDAHDIQTPPFYFETNFQFPFTVVLPDNTTSTVVSVALYQL